MREVNGMREDNFFAEPIVESKGRKPAPADTTLTIQSQNGPINVPVSRDGAVENFPISTELLAENPLVIANKPKGSLDLALQIRISPESEEIQILGISGRPQRSQSPFQKSSGDSRNISATD